VLANAISTPDDFSLRRKDYISETCFTDVSLNVFVVVPVLITTRVTSRGEKDSEFEDDKVLDFRCSPGYCQNQSHTNKTKSIS
jgi:hypothetical protein